MSILRPSPLFKPELRQANRDGRKTMTRRVVKLPDPSWILGKRPASWGPQDDVWPFYTMTDPTGTYPTGIRSPRGKPGDVWYMMEPLNRADGKHVYYCDTGGRVYVDDKPALWTWQRGILSSIHMPCWAARTFLTITDVRVERLQDISVEDIKREGVTYKTAIKAIANLAARAHVRPHHWIHGADEGISYCDRCIDKAVRKAKRESSDPDEICADGGWSQEEGGVSLCETCGSLVEYSLLNAGQEIQHFDDYWPKKMTPREAYELDRIFDSLLPDDDSGLPLAWRAVWDSINAKRGYPWESNPWVWVYSYRAATAEEVEKARSGK